MELKLEEREGTVTFSVRVQPRASRTEIAGTHAGAVKLRVHSPPVEGRANEECRRFLATILAVPRDAVEIVRGESSRNKVVRVRNTSAQLVRKALGI
jgi:uncharacterized protein (TIGR00251 family)